MPKLYAPEEFWSLSDVARADICNGCGAKGTAWLIPDTMYGLNVSPACDIHDYMYMVGHTEADREEADRVFLNNMLRIINAGSGWGWVKALRRGRAKNYYRAVRWFGGPFFWAGKNPAQTEGFVA
jgi:hypothetical protein